ncbi:MAG: iron-only hydrogenase system regulator [Treponema sp.]|nr:iron-only hydrogenase system regulator [Candidatus Treponema scatequi]
MDTKVALIGIVVSDLNAAQKLNELLHEYGEYIIGRMGLPYKKENISLVSVAIDAPLDKINALSGKLGAVEGISAKTIFPNK